MPLCTCVFEVHAALLYRSLSSRRPLTHAGSLTCGAEAKRVSTATLAVARGICLQVFPIKAEVNKVCGLALKCSDYLPRWQAAAGAVAGAQGRKARENERRWKSSLRRALTECNTGSQTRACACVRAAALASVKVLPVCGQRDAGAASQRRKALVECAADAYLHCDLNT